MKSPEIVKKTVVYTHFRKNVPLLPETHKRFKVICSLKGTSVTRELDRILKDYFLEHEKSTNMIIRKKAKSAVNE